MNRKALMWSLCALLYLMQIPFAVAVIIVAVDPNFSDTIFRAITIASIAVCVAAIALCVLNIVAAVRGFRHGADCPCATTVKVKLALIPFFIIWGLFWLGTFNPLLIWAAPVVWVISLFTTYLFMLGGGVQNIAYFARRFSAERKLKYLVYAVLHFIYIADVIAAVLACFDMKNQLISMPAEEI